MLVGTKREPFGAKQDWSWKSARSDFASRVLEAG